jgi:hypothetical protein
VIDLAFTGTVLTTKGLLLQNKVQAGAQLSFTKVKIGDGQLGSGQSLEALTDLIAPKKTLDISAVAVIGDGTSRVRAVVTNTGLAAGFFVREIGVFATDPDDGEILYCVANAGNECDYLPTPTSVAVEQTLDIIMAIGNATNVTAVINETIVLATVADITDHNDNPDAHNLRRWKAARTYAVGDICFSKLIATDSYKYFECTVAGTSGATEPTWPAVGNTVTDGTVTWIVRDLRVAVDADDNSKKLVTSEWVQALLVSNVPDALILTGGIMSGAIEMDSNKITGLADGTETGDAVHFGQFNKWGTALAGGCLLPNGLMIQWGEVTVTAQTTEVTFPLQFPAACYGVVSGLRSTASVYPYYASVIKSPTQTGYTQESYSITPNTYVFYIAIGQ